MAVHSTFGTFSDRPLQRNMSLPSTVTRREPLRQSTGPATFPDPMNRHVDEDDSGMPRIIPGKRKTRGWDASGPVPINRGAQSGQVPAQAQAQAQAQMAAAAPQAQAPVQADANLQPQPQPQQPQQEPAQRRWWPW